MIGIYMHSHAERGNEGNEQNKSYMVIYNDGELELDVLVNEILFGF
ncbi:MAG: hypothetical protein Q7S59_01550 [Sulfurimonas sp.]|nr:hypothetical protein [Sulfurimonas sp.]